MGLLSSGGLTHLQSSVKGRWFQVLVPTARDLAGTELKLNDRRNKNENANEEKWATMLMNLKSGKEPLQLA